MSTHSIIGIMDGNKCTAIYCHWDGYLECNGNILLQHYADPAKVKKLIALGNLSSLDKELDAKGALHTFDKPAKNVCVFYGRDRNESGQEAREFDTWAELDDYYGEQYYYIMKDGVWHFHNGRPGSEFILLNEAVTEECD